MAFIPIVAWPNYWRGIGIGGKHIHTHTHNTTTQEQVMVHETAALAPCPPRTHTCPHARGTRATAPTNSVEEPVKKVRSNSCGRGGRGAAVARSPGANTVGLPLNRRGPIMPSHRKFSYHTIRVTPTVGIPSQGAAAGMKYIGV